MYDQNIYFGDV